MALSGAMRSGWQAGSSKRARQWVRMRTATESRRPVRTLECGEYLVREQMHSNLVKLDQRHHERVRRPPVPQVLPAPPASPE